MDLVASAFFSLFSHSFFSVPPIFLLPSPLPGFSFFFPLNQYPWLASNSTLHLTFGLAVHLLYHYTTVIC